MLATQPTSDDNETQSLLSTPAPVYGYESTDVTEKNPDIVWNASRRRNFFRAAVIVLLAISVLGVFYLAFDASGASSDDGDDDCEYCDDDHTYEFWSGGSYHECLYFDDDTYFTAEVCSVYDEHPCYDDADDGLACTDNTWCDYFCGTYCAAGEGAICFFETLLVWYLYLRTQYLLT